VEVGDRGYFGPDFILEAREKVGIIRSHLKAAQNRQKTYADKRRRPLQFEVGDFVYLKVSPHERCVSFRDPWKTSFTLCWALQDFGPAWSSGLSHLAP
jgi:hypothetical protein